MAGTGARYFFLFLIGLMAGAIGTVMAVRAWDARRDHFHDSLMHVQQWHVEQLKGNFDQNRCNATDTLPHLQALRMTSNDIEAAFPDLSDDDRFKKAASDLRGVLEAASNTPPLSCESVGTTLGNIRQACKACHQDFR